MTLAGLLALAVCHAILVRGYTTVFYGDYGLWLHQVERFAHGERVYLDYYFASPPLAIWLVGSVAKIAGTDLGTIFTIMTVVYLGTVIAYWLFLKRLVPAPVMPAVAVTGFVLASAMAMFESAPWPLGMYNPAVPVGALCLFVSLVLAVPVVERGGVWRAALLGSVAALCIVAKQDFWPPALTVVALVALVRWRLHGDHAGPLAMGGAFVVTVGCAALPILASGGWAAVSGAATGFGQGSHGLARAIPSWQRLTIEGWVGALLGFWVAVCLAVSGARSRGVIAATIAFLTAAVALLIVFVTFDGGGSADLRTLRRLRDFGYVHLFPAFLPLVALGAAVWRGGRSPDQRLRLAVVGLAAVAAAARVRRGFEHVDWYHFLLELPIYVMALQLHFGERGRRASLLAMLGLLLVGCHLYFKIGLGPLTLAGAQAATGTPRGVVHWPENRVREFSEVKRLLDEQDPAGQRPVFKLGDNGGVNYFLRRPNPTPITQGFAYLLDPPEEALQDLVARHSSLFLIDDRVHDGGQQLVMRFAWDQWARAVRPVESPSIERVYFSRLSEGCAQLPHSRALNLLVLYDCGRKRP